jgi:hypothetical protein|tara:strand:+ start:2199 stop:2681 length:483 start_codon:yes stop_codon:yes gene_type:complete
MTDECVELKNIKYKTMLLSPENVEVDYKTKQNLINLDDLIKQDKLHTDNLPWSKLNKTMKLGKLNEFVEKYSKTHDMNCNEKNDLIKLLHDSLNKKLLQKAKDISYDKNDGTIKNIPNLVFNKNSRKHTLKNNEKKTSALKSLAPKNRPKTVKNKSDKKK